MNTHLSDAKYKTSLRSSNGVTKHGATVMEESESHQKTSEAKISQPPKKDGIKVSFTKSDNFETTIPVKLKYINGVNHIFINSEMVWSC